MKRYHFPLLLSLIFVNFSLLAQAPAGPRGERPPMPNAERFTERMTKELSLNAATSKKVHDAFLNNMKKMEAVFASKSAEKDKRAALDANKKAFQKSMKGILSPAQYAQFLKLEAERPGPPPPPPNGERPPRPR
jgi:Spy/CpxP family protein refolding chaperone